MPQPDFDNDNRGEISRKHNKLIAILRKSYGANLARSYETPKITMAEYLLKVIKWSSVVFAILLSFVILLGLPLVVYFVFDAAGDFSTSGSPLGLGIVVGALLSCLLISRFRASTSKTQTGGAP